MVHFEYGNQMQGHQHQQKFGIVAQTYEICIQTFTGSNVRWKIG